MGKGNNVYEDRAEKEEKRRRKAEEYRKKHEVPCPHCGKNLLDSMTKCPHCGGAVTPRGYRPMDAKLKRRIRIVSFVVGMAIAAVVLYFTVFGK